MRSLSICQKWPGPGELPGASVDAAPPRQSVKEAQRLGAGAHIKKPFLMEKLGMAVRRELDP